MLQRSHVVRDSSLMSTYVATYVTGFAKTVLNGTLIKLQYKPFKKHVKLYYFTSVFIALYLS